MRRNRGIKGSNVVLRRAVFARIGASTSACARLTDIDFAIRLGLEASSYARLDQRLVYCGQHAGPRLTRSSRQKVLLSTFRFCASIGR